GLQNTTVGELRSLWSRIEDLGFDWISIWDHLYAGDLTGPHSLEAVAMHAALALCTERVRCGSLVYCAAFRHPAVLANAAVTIDHLSGGRAELGLGAGWAEPEFRAHGIPFLPPGGRADVLEESARCVLALLRDEVAGFDGRHFRLDGARLEPRPVRDRLPLWIGGGGERRTLRLAAEVADGWNVPFVSPERFAEKRAVLHRHCEAVGRDPAEIRTAVNVALCWTEEQLVEQFGGLTEKVRPGVLGGSDQELADRVGAYEAAGADRVIVAMRAPWDVEGIERFASVVGLGR
ncbi:MAG TPA: LLM class flavin-dependent oxidoreductase, partial [Acidimicrobiales bacterium]